MFTSTCFQSLYTDSNIHLKPAFVSFNEYNIFNLEFYSECDNSPTYQATEERLPWPGQGNINLCKVCDSQNQETSYGDYESFFGLH